MAKKKGSGKGKKKPVSKPAKSGKTPPDREPTLKELKRTLDNLKKQNEKLQKELAKVSAQSRDQQKQLISLQGKMDTRVKREDILMAALGINTRTKKGDSGAVGKISQSLIKTDEHLVKMGKRIENMLSALKNHREYLIRLNKKVYKVEPMKKIEMELGIMNNTLSIMALSGFNIDKALFGDMKNIRKMMLKEDAEIAKVQKRMVGFKRKFEEEMQRFDLDSIFNKGAHIPGYR
ncbi:MAG: hypothetical protein KKH41_01775 [Candidatus Thermoplasmatota archaeon]|nr:hypothetical protein [Euryarchaeota archaeon]MBU4143630.1 hypothetical protein [Candidatus Thermoplasmatota archaeon]MBU4591290.1 hypothetical protein [Candidatus Thermoplasmatota archaeon]